METRHSAAGAFEFVAARLGTDPAVHRNVVSNSSLGFLFVTTHCVLLEIRFSIFDIYSRTFRLEISNSSLMASPLGEKP